MKALLARYLNEVVGLTIMALMTVALIAGQAGAVTQNASINQSHDRAIIEIHLSLKD
jgi:hypothetical protein